MTIYLEKEMIFQHPLHRHRQQIPQLEATLVSIHFTLLSVNTNCKANNIRIKPVIRLGKVMSDIRA